jgi:hypothetical protein
LFGSFLSWFKVAMSEPSGTRCRASPDDEGDVEGPSRLLLPSRLSQQQQRKDQPPQKQEEQLPPDKAHGKQE